MNEVRLPLAGRAGLATPVEPDEMATEIAGGPEAVEATLIALHDNHAGLVGEVSAARDVVLVGTGASLAMVRCAAPLWRAHDLSTGARRQLTVLEGSELAFGSYAGGLDRDALIVVAVSKSGSGPEIRSAVDLAKSAGRRVVVVTAVEHSALAAAAEHTVVTPIGEEQGAATKSALGALAALLALGGVLDTEPQSVARLRSLLTRARADEQAAYALGTSVGDARRVWVVGFGSGYGVADALGLLLHEKAQLAAISTTPSAFRHGLVEASARGDAVVAVACDAASPVVESYLDRLGYECGLLGIRTGWITAAGRDGEWVPLQGDTPAAQTLEAVLRAQQVAHIAAHRAGTYVDGFKVLRTFVSPGEAFA